MTTAEAAINEVNRLTEEGLLRIMRGDRDGALPLLERAVHLGADDVAVRIELARTYRLNGRPKDAVRLLEAVVTPASEAGSRRELARARLESRDYSAAGAESAALIEEIDLSALQPHELPSVLDVYEIGAEAARGMGDSIRTSVLYSALQRLLLKHNRRDLAEQARALERHNAEQFARQQAEVDRSAEAPADQRLTDFLGEAHGHLRAGLVFAALDRSYDALALDSSSLQPFLEIAESYVVAAQPVAAVKLLHSIQEIARLRQSNVELAPIRRLLGRISGDLALREQAIQRFIEQGDTVRAVDELHDLADEAQALGERERAVHLYERALRLDPHRRVAAFSLAELLVQQGKEGEAIGVLQSIVGAASGVTGLRDATQFWADATERLPDVPLVRQAFAEELRRRGRPADGARELLRAADVAARRGETDLDSLLAAAQLYDELDDLPSALRTYDRLMRQAPSSALAQEHFVAFCLRRNRPDLAGRTLRALAEYVMSRGEPAGPAEAVATLTQLMVLQADDPWAYERLAAILMQEGRGPEAIMVYRQLAARRPNDVTVRARLRQLSGGGEAMARTP